MSIIPDLLILSTAIYILGVSKEYYYSDFASSLLGNISVCLCLVIITYVLKKPLKKLINYNLSTNKKIIVMSSVTLVMLAIFFYNLIKTFEFNNNIITYLAIIVMLICILLYLFKQKIENEKISKNTNPACY